MEIDDGSYTDLKKAMTMARLIDPKADHYTEYTNGFHFIIREEEYSLNDPGFAIAKADGHLYRGLEAHEFLSGEIITEGDFC